MPVVFYPPNMPLHEQYIFHRRQLERFWATPVPFMPLVILATVLFIGGVWGLNSVYNHLLPAAFNPRFATILFSLLPPLIVVGVIMILPRFSSPVWPYQVALLHDPGNNELRWNLAVVATAHIYCGSVAQMEWLSQMIGFSKDDRARALSYIKGVRSRLQQIHVIVWRDVLLCLGAAVTVFLMTWLVCPSRNHQYSQIESLLNSTILLLVMSLLMFYLLLQRWQHIRRLIELEEVFEALLPAKKTTPGQNNEDEVERWYREQHTEWSPSESNPSEYPPAPWE